MKKRRIASTRNMNKQEKRRLQLNKRQDTNNSSRNMVEKRARAGFAHPADSRQVLSFSNTTVKTPLNKRIIAIILAIVMVAGLIPAGIFMLRPKAATSAALSPVTMKVRINGKDAGTTTINPGKIADNIGSVDVDLPENAAYVKSVVVDNQTEAETQIYAVGAKKDQNENEHIYYSISQAGLTGVEKATNDELVLVFANKYNVNFESSDNAKGTITKTDGAGSFTTTAHYDDSNHKYYVWGGENLVINEIKATQDHAVNKITYSTSKTKGTERVKNSKASISSEMINGDINVDVSFKDVDHYSIQDARYMSGSIYYPDYYGLDNHGGATANENAKGNVNSLGVANPDDTKTIYVFSQKNTSSQKWRLSMLSVNGVDLKFPSATGSANAISTPFKDGRSISVEYVTETKQFSDESNSPRTLYKVVIPNIHENIEINYYFTDIRTRKVIVKGLRGINQTAAAVENRIGTGAVSGVWYTFTTNKLNVYDAFQHDFTLSGANLILYTVKPGYNPYEITTSVICDGQEKPVRASSVTGAPVDVILDAGRSDSYEGGRFNTNWRYWGKNDKLYRHDEKRNGDTLLLTTLSKDKENTWYAVALSQDAATNQQLYLDADPYEYKIALYPNGDNVTLTDEDYAYDVNQGRYIESVAKGHTVEANTYGFLPTEAPTQPGKVFAGWRMMYYDKEKNRMEELDDIDHFYQPSARIDLNDDVFVHAFGENSPEDQTANQQVIAFKAIWKDLKDADVTTVQVNSNKQTDVNEDGTPVYITVLSGENGQEKQVKGQTAVLDDQTGLASNEYYTVAEGSNLVSETKAQSTDDTIPADNIFNVDYIYNTVDLSVTNTVLGYPKTQTFEIKVTFTKDPDSPVDTMTKAKNLIKATLRDSETVFEPEVDETAGTLTYTLRLTRDQIVDFTNVPYKWTYSVAEEEKEKDYKREISSENGTLTKNEDIVVTNMVDNEEIHTTKKIVFDENTNKYKLQLEAWATGESVTTYDKEPVPTDITLVIDQSGSMATKDMNAEPQSVGTSWTITNATSGTQKYYKVGNGDNAKYYPVQALEGPLYYKVPNDEKPQVYQMYGRGHQEAVGQDLNVHAKLHFNVPTSYYCMGTDNKIHKIWFVTTGAFALYHAYPYYYYNDEDIYIPSANDGLTKGDTDSWKLINGGPEWRCTVGYLDVPFSAENWLKLADVSNNSPYGGSNGGYIVRSPWLLIVGRYPGVEPMIKLSYNHDIGLVGQTDTKISNWDAVEKEYFFFTNGSAIDGDVYLPVDGTTFNRLCYIDSNGNKVEIPNTTVYTEDQTLSCELYEYHGTETRTQVLQRAVTNFVGLIQQNAQENDLQHRISIVGFAGNRTPALSSGSTAYNNTTTRYDYTDTGIFVNNQFINYESIKAPDSAGYVALSSSDTAYINYHYYIKRGSTYIPIKYTNGKWITVEENPQVVTRSTYTFYEAQYDKLREEDYVNSLVPVNDNGEVNENIKNAINNFGSYGGTYTSYGMTMANKVLEYTYDPDRNHIIVVFTDGEPGGNGFDESIAGEAKADSNIAKNDFKAKVYTVGLFPGSGNASVDAQEFLTYLSSEKTQAIVEITPTSKGVDSELKNTPEKKTVDYTYYYTDEDGKTFSVKAKRQGESSLGWWNNNGTAYTLLQPRDASNDNRSYVTPFYKSDGSEAYSDEVDAHPDETYYTSSSSQTESTAIRYEYRWYNSNNAIVEPKTTTSDGYQFFELGDVQNKIDSTQYCLYASDAQELLSSFETIAESMVRTTVTLDADSILRDVITTNFGNVNSNDVTVQYDTVDHYDNGEPVWTNNPQPLEGKTVDLDTQRVSEDSDLVETQIDVKGFNYSAHHVSADNADGQKVIVTINNVDPLETGFNLESNTDASGIYRIKEDTPSMIVPFDNPLVNRPEYSLVVDGDDKEARYAIAFRLTTDAGDPIPENQIIKMVDNLNDENVVFRPVSKNGETYLVWENITADTDVTAILEDVFKDIPEGYHVFATPTKTSGDDSAFDYSVKLNHKASDSVGFDKEFELKRSGDEIEITSNRKTTDITIREITTKALNSTTNYSDPEKLFEIELTLKNGDGMVSGTFDGITFNEGKATIQMKHEQQKTIALPVGYTLDIDVTEDSQKDTYGNYKDSYAENLTATEPTSTTNDTFTTTISAGKEITIINSIDDNGPPTGILEAIEHLNPFVWVVIAVVVIGGAWLMILEKRKRRLVE